MTLNIGISELKVLRKARDDGFSSLTLDQTITLLEVALENGFGDNVSAGLSTFHVHDPLATHMRLTVDLDPEFRQQLEDALDQSK